MKIKVLLENTKSDPVFKSGHGLAILIQDADKKYLFDTGPNKKFLKNAQVLGESLTDLDSIIISHGHSDHTGGLPYLDYRHTKLYLAPAAIEAHYLKLPFQYFYVGMPKKDKAKIMESAIWVTEKLKIAENLFIVPLGKTPQNTANLYKSVTDKKIPDDFSDELMLIKEEKDGLLVFTGCSHHGIVPMAKTALQLFPNKKIKYLIGGFHLIGIPYLNNLGKSPEEIIQIAKTLDELPVEQILTCHCTGKKAFALLKQSLGSKISPLASGQVVTLSKI